MVRTSLLSFFKLRRDSIASKEYPFHRPDNHKIHPEGAKEYLVEHSWHQAKALDNIKPAFVDYSPKLDKESKRNLAELLIVHVFQSEKASRRFRDFMINSEEKILFVLVDMSKKFSLEDSDSTFRLLQGLRFTKSEKELGLRLEAELAIQTESNQAEIKLPLIAEVRDFPPDKIRRRVVSYVNYLISEKVEANPNYFQDLKKEVIQKSFNTLNADQVNLSSIFNTKIDKKLNFIDEWLIAKGKIEPIYLDANNSEKNMLKVQQVDKCHISVERSVEKDPAIKSSKKVPRQGHLDAKMTSDFYLNIPIEYVYAGQRYEENISYPMDLSEVQGINRVFTRRLPITLSAE
jgi:hypothetical protein